MARYNTDGSLDTTFNGDGKVITSLSVVADELTSLALQPDGKIVAGGRSYNDTTFDDFALVRYTSNGDLDTTFGTNGIVINDFGLTYEGISSIAIQTDGKIIAAGYGEDGIMSHMLIVRYNSNGSIDSSFDSDGKLYISFGASGYDGVTSMVLQTDGKILVAGYHDIGTDIDYALSRINTDGTLDSSFGINGKVTTAIGTYYDEANALAIQSDGKIVAAGRSLQVFSMARYNNDGSLDLSFSGDGKLMTQINTWIDNTATSIAIQPDGKIILAGYAKTSQFFYDFALARYISTFNVGTIDFSSPNNSMLIYPNPIGKEATLKYDLSTDENLIISLFDLNGQLVNTFLSNEKRMKGNHSEVLHLSELLATGNYVLQISNGKSVKSIKIMKQ